MKALSIALLTSAMFLVLAQPVVAAEESWTDRITFNGDVRFRFESNHEKLRHPIRVCFAAAPVDTTEILPFFPVEKCSVKTSDIS